MMMMIQCSAAKKNPGYASCYMPYIKQFKHGILLNKSLA